jgi:hypothetical protein
MPVPTQLLDIAQRSLPQALPFVGGQGIELAFLFIGKAQVFHSWRLLHPKVLTFPDEF